MRKLEVLLFNEIVGFLYAENKGDKEVFSFEYDPNWLKKYPQFVFDIDIYPYNGRQYPSLDVFGFVRDSLPDRFGRLLLDEEENRIAKEEKRLPKKLTTLDYLTNVNDLTRVGAFQFKDEKGNLLSIRDSSVPPYIYLRDIEEASIEFEKNGSFNKETYRRLLLPGSSLGGARPKANIYFNDELWIAKFPSINDSYNIEVWEKIVTDLAKMCNIDTCNTRLESYSELGSTLLIERFDREKNKRIHYASFMNMLGAEDGDSGIYSYLDLVSFIRGNFIDVDTALKELYKRVIFNYLINNTDNHLRNHGLLFKDNKWVLAPIFDINPTFFETRFSLNATEEGYSKDIIINSSKYYLIKKEDAIKMYDDIYDVLSDNLNTVAKKYNTREKEIAIFGQFLSSRK